MKRSLDEPTSEPRKSSRASHIETETASSSKVLKKDRRDSEGHLEATSTSSRTIKPVAPILTPAESYAKQKASAKRWAEEEFKKKATVPKSPAKPSIVALDAKAETLPAVTRKIRKSVTTPKVMPPSVAHAASVETAIIRPVPTIRIPLIKIERPRPQQDNRVVSMAAPRVAAPAPAPAPIRTSRTMKAALGMPFFAILVLHLLEKKPIPSSIFNCPIEAFLSVALIGLLHMCSC